MAEVTIESPPRGRGLRSPLLPIFLTVFVDVLGLTIVLPLLPFYAEHFGASPLVVGTLTASYAACQLVSGPVLGRTSDRVGRKPTLLVSQMGTFVGFLTIGFANTLWMLFLGRIIDGLTAGNLSIAQAYISDVTRPEERTKAFGIIGISFGAGFLLGPAISGVLAHRFGYSAPAFAAAALSLTSIAFTAALLPAKPPRFDAEEASAPADGAAGAASDPPPVGRRNLDFSRYFARPEPRRRLLEFFGYLLAFSTLIGGMALFLERRFHFDVEKTGYVFAYGGLIGGLVQGPMLGRLAKRYGEERLALVGLVSLAVGFALVGEAFSIPVLLLMATIGNFGVAVTRPALTTLLTKSVGRDEQGGVLGTSQALASIAQITGPVLAGFLIGKELFLLWGLAVAVFALAAAATMLRRGGLQRPTSA